MWNKVKFDPKEVHPADSEGPSCRYSHRLKSYQQFPALQLLPLRSGKGEPAFDAEERCWILSSCRRTTRYTFHHSVNSAMQHPYLILVFVLLFTGVSFGTDVRVCLKASGVESDTVDKRVPLGDPFIMLWDDRYYAYGTQSEDGIVVYESDDLITWSVPDGAREGLALHKDDVWGERWFWAPEVYYVNGKFYMYFSAEEHICVATSDSPLGPFKQAVQKPMIADEKCIDNSLFIDDTGMPYLFFDRFNDGLNMWSAELEGNLLQIKPETMRKCINVSQPWEEVWPRVNEGCFVIKRNGTYYMTYSANSYESQFYGIGFATATSINGPWIKYEKNPIFQKPGDLVGVGHSAMFRDKNGDLRIVFHAHNNKEEIHPRHMYISTVTFKKVDGKEIMVVDDDYMTPRLR